MQEADKAQKDIVKQAEEQIKNILDKSTYRQNFYDTLTRIANIPEVEAMLIWNYREKRRHWLIMKWQHD